MIICLDGVQGSGKSTLIENLSRRLNIPSYKFDFPRYTTPYGFNNRELGCFQLGKDLALLDILSQNTKNHLLLDRGPFSSVYYGIKENRLSYKQLSVFLGQLESFKNFGFVFIQPLNQESFSRNKNDGFDGLDKENDPWVLETLKNYLQGKRIPFNFFYNNFQESPDTNAEYLENKIKLFWRWL